jgi:enoyl-CoA hydratase
VAHVTVAEQDGVTTLKADRPPANAMNVEFMADLVGALERLAAAPPAALVIAGRDGFFSAGADLKVVPTYGAGDQRRMVADINAMVNITYGLPCPVVAAITGHAIAGGLVFALCADYRIASTDGQYGLTEVKVGVPYPQAAIGVVRAELSSQAARMMALGNELIAARDCVRLGAFDEARPADEVIARAREVAARLGAMPAGVYARTKLDLRAATLATMRDAAATDPLLDAWVD